LENEDIMGGGTGSDSEPADVPPVGTERVPGVVTGSPLPRLRSVVQPNAAMDAQREIARSVRIADRSCKLLVVSGLIMLSPCRFSTGSKCYLEQVLNQNRAGTTVAMDVGGGTRSMNRNRTLFFLSLVLVALVASACSLNRQLPEAADEEAMVIEVRSAIASAVPGKTFALSVDVTEGGRVKLSGHVDNNADREAIIAKVRQVNGVTSVDASELHVG
jgi:hypothetical protein